MKFHTLYILYVSLNKGSEQLCREENLKYNDGLMEEAVVCHCTEDKCNGETPVIPSKGTSIQFRETYLGIMLCIPIMFISFNYL